MKYRIALEVEEDGRVSAHCLDLPGCHSWGHNREEALKNIREAIEGYRLTLEKRAKDYNAVELVEVAL